MKVQLWKQGRLVSESQPLTREVAEAALEITLESLRQLPQFEVVMVDDDPPPPDNGGRDWDGMKVPLHPHDCY